MVVQTLEDFGDRDRAPSGKEQVTLYVSSKRIRFDKGQSMSSIILLDKKVTFSIMHESQRYVVLFHDQIKGEGPAAKTKGDINGKMLHDDVESLDTSVIEATGKTETINGFLCQQVLIKERDGTRTELWVSQEALDMKTFLGEFRSFMEFGFSQMAKELEKHPELRGVPIRVVDYDRSKMLRRATIERLETHAIPNSVFEVPAGYRELKMSDFAPPNPEGNDLENLRR